MYFISNLSNHSFLKKKRAFHTLQSFSYTYDSLTNMLNWCAVNVRTGCLWITMCALNSISCFAIIMFCVSPAAADCAKWSELRLCVTCVCLWFQKKTQPVFFGKKTVIKANMFNMNVNGCQWPLLVPQKLCSFCRLIYYPPYNDDFKYRQLIDHAVGRWGDYLTSIPNYYLDYHL